MGEPVTVQPVGTVAPTEVTVPEPVERQVPLIAKQPVFPEEVTRFIPPPWKVEVAVVEAKMPEVPARERREEGDEVPMPIFPVERVASEPIPVPKRRFPILS